MFKIFIKIKNSGFSILEVMVALSILSIGLLGVSSLVIQNLQVQNINKNYLTASMLAQEGLELVRNQRDTNWLKGADWLTGSGGNTDILQDWSYAIDASGDMYAGADDFSNAITKLFIDNDGFYLHNIVGTSTPFSRIIRVLPHPLAGPYDYITASSTVRWNDSGRVNTYVAETQFFNWR